MIIEACTENFIESVNAEKNGAHRIELCENLSLGGTTPSYGTLKACKKHLNIPIFAMIRPRPGNFIYSKEEIEIMKDDINICKMLGIDGVAFGTIMENSKHINYNFMRQLIEVAKGMEIIIHRAFDEIEKPLEEIEKLAVIGVNHILSSGGAKKIEEGKDLLNKIYKECQKHNIKLTAAGGITDLSLASAKEMVKADAYHGRKIVSLV